MEYQNSRKKLRSLIEETVAMFREWVSKFNKLHTLYICILQYNQPMDTKSKFKPVDPVIATLISINMAVFFLWRVGNQQIMLRYFANGIASSKSSNNLIHSFHYNCSESLCTPMLLSVFSHSHWLHLALNMYVLYNFAVPTVGFLGKEQVF